jgi:hypothetical protein
MKTPPSVTFDTIITNVGEKSVCMVALLVPGYHIEAVRFTV